MSHEMKHIAAGYISYMKGEPKPDRSERTKEFRAGWMIALQASRKKVELPAGNRVRRRLPNVD